MIPGGRSLHFAMWQCIAELFVMVEYPFVSSQAIIDKKMIGGLTPLWHNIHQIWTLMFLQLNPSYALHSCINKNAPLFLSKSINTV